MNNHELEPTHDYYAFGQTMPGRNWISSVGGYRYGFNSKENDKEFNEGAQDFGDRIYENRLGRWLSVDPLARLYPNFSPYHFGYDNPIYYKDKNGDVISGVTKQDFEKVYASVIQLFTNAKLKKEIFQIAENGTSFKEISKADFEAATEGLDANAKSLAKGYYEAINSSHNYQIKVVDNNTQFNDDFKNSVLEDQTSKENFSLKSGGDLSNTEYNGGAAIDINVNKSLLILNYQYITTDSKLQVNQSLSGDLFTRNFNSALTNAIFGEFFAKDNFIKDKRSKDRGWNADYFITKTQMENMAQSMQKLPQTNGYPIFPTWGRNGLTDIPKELMFGGGADVKPTKKKDSGTHGDARNLDDGYPNK